MLPKQNPIASSKMFPTAGRSFRSERPLPEPCPSFDAARRARVDVSGRPSPRHHLHAAGRKAGQQRRALACAAGAEPRAEIGTGRFSSMVSTHLLTRLSAWHRLHLRPGGGDRGAVIGTDLIGSSRWRRVPLYFHVPSWASASWTRRCARIAFLRGGAITRSEHHLPCHLTAPRLQTALQRSQQPVRVYTRDGLAAVAPAVPGRSAMAPLRTKSKSPTRLQPTDPAAAANAWP